MNYKLNIREIRNNKGISQRELADIVGISPNYLSELEHCKFDIKLSLLLKIASALDVELKELYIKIE